jgi:uncharacterized protein YbcV (DUF1398 family)
MSGGKRALSRTPVLPPVAGVRAILLEGMRTFTMEQINDGHERLGNAATPGAYLRELNTLGVQSSTSYLCDGHTEFFGSDGYSLRSPAAHARLTVADTSNRAQFLEHLELHSQQKTSYVEMSRGLADSGIEKWTMDTRALTVTYYDKTGNELLVEKIS